MNIEIVELEMKDTCENHVFRDTKNNVFQEIEIMKEKIDVVREKIKKVMEKDTSIFYKQKIDEVMEKEIGNVYYNNGCNVCISIKHLEYKEYLIETEINGNFIIEIAKGKYDTVKEKINILIHTKAFREESHTFLRQKIDDIIKENIGDEYTNHCWYCNTKNRHTPITGFNKKCPVCRRFFLCPKCGMCLCDMNKKEGTRNGDKKEK